MKSKQNALLFVCAFLHSVNKIQITPPSEHHSFIYLILNPAQCYLQDVSVCDKTVHSFANFLVKLISIFLSSKLLALSNLTYFAHKVAVSLLHYTNNKLF